MDVVSLFIYILATAAIEVYNSANLDILCSQLSMRTKIVAHFSSVFNSCHIHKLVSCSRENGISNSYQYSLVSKSCQISLTSA